MNSPLHVTVFTRFGVSELFFVLNKTSVGLTVFHFKETILINNRYLFKKIPIFMSIFATLYEDCSK